MERSEVLWTDRLGITLSVLLESPACISGHNPNNNESIEMSEKRIIEINGVKMEIDTRHAVRVDKLAVGTRVKVIRKKYGDE